MTIQNEPGYHNFNSLLLDGHQEKEFLKNDLGPELHKNHYTKDKFHVMIYDYNLPGMKNYVQTVLNDKSAADLAWGIAFHWYATNEQNRADLKELHKEFPNHPLLSTEACVGTGEATFGNWDPFTRYAEDIIKNLNYYSTGWVDWNMALDKHVGPNWAKGSCDSPIIISDNGHEYYKQPTFYAMGHFSKFLGPNSVRIHHVSNTKDHANLEVVTFERPDSGTVLTILNKNSHEITMHVHDPQQGYAEVKVKAHSLKTLIWY